MTLWALVSTRIVEELFLIREERSVLMPEPYWSVPPEKDMLPEEPSAAALPICSVPAERAVPPV